MYKVWPKEKERKKINFKKIGIGVLIVSNLGIKNFGNQGIEKPEIIEEDYFKVETLETTLLTESIEKKLNYEFEPEQFMRKMGRNLCARYAKLVAQSMGYEFKHTINMNAWEMPYNLHKDGWINYEVNEIKNLRMLFNNLELGYINSSIKRIERAKNFLKFNEHEEINKLFNENKFDEINKFLKLIIEEKLNDLPNGTLFFIRNNRSNFLRIADRYKRGAPTHVIIKHKGKWKDYDYVNERKRDNKEIQEILGAITHISIPPKIETEIIEFEIPSEIRELQGIKKLHKAMEISQIKNPYFWHYLTYRMYKSEEKEIKMRMPISY